MSKVRVSLNLKPLSRIRLKVLAVQLGKSENAVLEQFLEAATVHSWEKLQEGFTVQLATGKPIQEIMHEYRKSYLETA